MNYDMVPNLKVSFYTKTVRINKGGNWECAENELKKNHGQPPCSVLLLSLQRNSLYQAWVQYPSLSKEIALKVWLNFLWLPVDLMSHHIFSQHGINTFQIARNMPRKETRCAWWNYFIWDQGSVGVRIL